ncbi:MAG: dephospho-CoA kinase [Burkholderiales bacterium]
MRRFTVGITGGIGSGKSAVAELFSGHGVAVIDTDAIAHELTRPGGAAIGPIRSAFGASVISPDGALDRTRMRKLAFTNPTAKKRLEAILHPLIKEQSARLAEHAVSPYVVLVVPLLVESGADRSRYQRVVVVDCPEALQVERVIQRSGLSEKEVRDIMAAQATRDERLARADDVIDNSGAREALAAQVERLHEKYITLAANSSTSS